jgi:hypothetical protein
MWSDIQSNTMDIADYLKYIKKKGAYNYYEDYNFNRNVLQEIRSYLDEHDKRLKFFAIGAFWCPDCSRQVPALVRIGEELGDRVNDMKFLYGVKTNPFHKEGEPLWHKKHSPPEATDPKFDLRKIPTIYIFTEEGNYLGRIIEKPKNGNTLEDEIWLILQEKL